MYPTFVIKSRHILGEARRVGEAWDQGVLKMPETEKYVYCVLSCTQTKYHKVKLKFIFFCCPTRIKNDKVIAQYKKHPW